MQKTRNINLDIIRCMAAFCVVSVHFFLNCGFYGWTFVGGVPFAACCMRALFMICVPLFLMLTGYLMNNKRISKRYYKGIVKTILIYILCTVCILMYRCVYLNESLTVLDMFTAITTYSHYSWYIGMYIGLFLLIPFFNNAYHGLSSKKEKAILVLTLLFLNTLASLINSIYLPIFPTYWAGLYPPMYYFIGVFICDCKDDIRISTKWNALLIILAVLLSGSHSYFKSYGAGWLADEPGAYGDIKIIIIATLVFCFLLRIDAEGIPVIAKKIIYKVSDVSLSIYLLSWIFDNFYYKFLNERVGDSVQRFYYYPIMVFLVFGSSFMLGVFVEYIFKVVMRLFPKK